MKVLLIISLTFSALLFAGVARSQDYRNVQVNLNANNPEETSIAINPNNMDNVLGVAQAAYCFFYPSFTGGQVWSEGHLPDPYCLGDPSIVFDRRGTAYYGFIGNWSHSGIFINRSTDEGRTWQPTGTAVIQHDGQVPFEDKPYPVCDWSQGPYAGNVYVSWTQFTHYGSHSPADSSRILFARSTDSGRTFSSPLQISRAGGDAVDSSNTVEGAMPAVGSDGSVYDAWSGPRGIEFCRSTDGGRSFGSPAVISDQPGGWAFDVPGIYRCNGLPVTRADISSGSFGGRIYVNWSDRRNGDTDVFLISSDDGGRTWSPRVRVNDDPLQNGRDQFFTWFDVDPVTGFVYVVFYDRREHPDNLTTDVYMAISQDGGAHFTNQKISAASFVPDARVFFGDYIGISAFAGRVRPLWMRMDGFALSVWTALIDLPSAGLPDIAGKVPRILVEPNPLRTTSQIVCCDGKAGPIELAIRDVTGRLVRQLGGSSATADRRVFVWNARDQEGRLVAPGVYFVSGRDVSATRIVVVR